jgi:hypothetical protein
MAMLNNQMVNSIDVDIVIDYPIDLLMLEYESQPQCPAVQVFTQFL